MPDTPPVPGRPRSGAIAVAAGIFLSRIAGLIRERVIAHYLGLSPAAAAFRAAMRIPNLLQNLLGEGVLSASFIPVYVRLMAEGKHQAAAKVARVIGTLLALVASGIALLGVFAAEPLVDLLAPGYEESTRELTVQLVRIMFPGTALLVMSAWCLGVLNSHGKFFLSYVSPVLWNAALIGAAVAAGSQLTSDGDLAVWLAWGAVIGSGAQFLIQLPTVISLLRGVTPSLDTKTEGVGATLRAFVPVLIGRGSVQISAYIDQIIASYLGEAIVAAMAYAQTLYLLPVSLFGMAISAAELPAMSGGPLPHSVRGDDEARAEHLQKRLTSSLRRVIFLVVPSAIAFVAIGGAIVTLLFETGRFSARDSELVWMILAGSALGLVPNTVGRLLGSALYALQQPKPVLYASLLRIALGTGLGFTIALPLRDVFGYSAGVAAFGLTATTGVAGWIELALLRGALAVRIGPPPIPWRLAGGALLAAAAAGALGYGASRLAAELGLPGWLAAIAAIGVFGAVYLGAMVAAKVPETRALTRRLLRR
ncbi:MAG: murein biosynthesis integral membrane protein MurJ [Deltaproteobacteria bacterium]|nr:murein biosynthesis integral membrane protein MurJ [Deltaproteobacteria bacterium]